MLRSAIVLALCSVSSTAGAAAQSIPPLSYAKWLEQYANGPSIGPRRSICCFFGVRRDLPPVAVQRAQKWLVDHQDADGRWDADGFMKHDRGRRVAGGTGSPLHDVAVTSLAMLALISTGSTMRSGPHRQSLKKAVRWLRNQQMSNGRFGGGSSQSATYDHVLATYAMCEVAGISGYRVWRRFVQLGLDHLETLRLADGGWGYASTDRDSNLSLTGWCVLALKSARDFEYRIEAAALPGALRRVDQLMADTGRCGYRTRREPSFRHSDEHLARFPRAKSETLTAIGLVCHNVIPLHPKTTPRMTRAADLLCERLPARRRGSTDAYYWFFGTYALYLTGGPQFKKWSRGLAKGLVKTQRRDGSWDPIGIWGEDGGRVYTTAMMTMTLTAYHRYTRLVR